LITRKKGKERNDRMQGGKKDLKVNSTKLAGEAKSRLSWKRGTEKKKNRSGIRGEVKGKGERVDVEKDRLDEIIETKRGRILREERINRRNLLMKKGGPDRRRRLLQKGTGRAS